MERSRCEFELGSMATACECDPTYFGAVCEFVCTCDTTYGGTKSCDDGRLGTAKPRNPRHFDTSEGGRKRVKKARLRHFH